MIVITYHIGLGDKIREYLLPWHGGFPGKKAIATLEEICKKSGIGFIPPSIEQMQSTPAPEKITYKMEGKWPRILTREWREINIDEVPF